MSNWGDGGHILADPEHYLIHYQNMIVVNLLRE
jgi:hypothetical protein